MLFNTSSMHNHGLHDWRKHCFYDKFSLGCWILIHFWLNVENNYFLIPLGYCSWACSNVGCYSEICTSSGVWLGFLDQLFFVKIFVRCQNLCVSWWADTFFWQIPSSYGPERLDLLRQLEKVKEMENSEDNSNENGEELAWLEANANFVQLSKLKHYF